MPDNFTFSYVTLEQVQAFARAIAPMLHAGDVVVLHGDLGVGKTTFTRECLYALSGNIALDVPSPTFILIQTYDDAEFAIPVLHMDLYRTSSANEVDELGIDELLPRHISFVEWPDHGQALWVQNHLAIHMTMDVDGNRTWRFAGIGSWEQRLPRMLAIKEQLAQWSYGEFRRVAMAGDASSRRYERMMIAGDKNAPRAHVKHENNTQLIIMDAPPKPDAGLDVSGPSYSQIAHLAEDQTPFVAISKTLNFRGFSAPKVFRSDIPNGILVLEDLGNEGVLDEHGAPIPERYEAAAQTLAAWHGQKLTGKLPIQNGHYTLPPYDLDCMLAEVELFLQWCVPDVLGASLSAAQIQQFHDVWADILAPVSDKHETLVLRDFHSPNILWCADRPMPKTIGIIDFQDGLHGPCAYDLASLAQDARVDVSETLEHALLQAYSAARLNVDPAYHIVYFQADYAVMGAQRATKILGIFSRLCIRDHKPRYKAHQPRVWGYLKRNLRHEMLAPFKNWLESTGISAALDEKLK